jgi:hypothetical protein
MTELEGAERVWAAGTDPQAMLRIVTENPDHDDINCASPRKLRLIACAMCREVWPRLTDPRSRRAVEVAERFADGLATVEDLYAASDEAAEALGLHDLSDIDTVEWIAASDASMVVAYYATTAVGSVVKQPRCLDDSQSAAILRDLCNPFAPLWMVVDTIPAEPLRGRRNWLLRAWLTPDVRRLAGVAYRDRPGRECGRCGGRQYVSRRLSDDGVGWPAMMEMEDCPDCHGTGRTEDGRLDPDTLAVLSDALEEAGAQATACGRCGGDGTVERESYTGNACPKCLGAGRVDNPLVAHLRSSEIHVRGCWAVDLLTGRE